MSSSVINLSRFSTISLRALIPAVYVWKALIVSGVNREKISIRGLPPPSSLGTTLNPPSTYSALPPRNHIEFCNIFDLFESRAAANPLVAALISEPNFFAASASWVSRYRYSLAYCRRASLNIFPQPLVDVMGCKDSVILRPRDVGRLSIVT